MRIIYNKNYKKKTYLRKTIFDKTTKRALESTIKLNKNL